MGAMSYEGSLNVAPTGGLCADSGTTESAYGIEDNMTATRATAMVAKMIAVRLRCLAAAGFVGSGAGAGFVGIDDAGADAIAEAT